MSDENEDQYAVSVSVEHPQRPTATLRLSWPEEKTTEFLHKAISDMAVYALQVSLSMEGRL